MAEKENNENIFACFVSPGAQSDSELPSHHPIEVSLDRGYTSDSEVYNEHSKTRIPRSTTDVDVASSGWLVVSTRTHTRTSSHIYRMPAWWAVRHNVYCMWAVIETPSVTCSVSHINQFGPLTLKRHFICFKPLKIKSKSKISSLQRPVMSHLYSCDLYFLQGW